MILELTRKCNIKCAHCLRGPARRDSMAREVLLAVADNAPTDIWIGGGEPSLAVDQFEELIYLLRTRPAWEVEYLNLVTNGKTVRHPFMQALYDLSLVCEEIIVHVSEDIYHQVECEIHHAWKHKEYIIQADPYDPYPVNLFDIIEVRSKPSKYSQGVLPMGRALDLGVVYDEEVIGCIEEVDPYVTINGDVFASCNLSYKEMNRDSELYMGNILEEDIESMLEKFENRVTFPLVSIAIPEH